MGVDLRHVRAVNTKSGTSVSHSISNVFALLSLPHSPDPPSGCDPRGVLGPMVKEECVFVEFLLPIGIVLGRGCVT